MRFTKSLWVLMVGMLVLVAVGMAPEAARGQSGIVIGRVTDSQNGESLPGASMRIAGTALGAATDLDGAYRIPGVPAGRQTLVVSYVGYLAQELIITVLAGGTVRQDVVLSFGVVEGEEIVVTAQLEGQARAINQQLASNTIVNVVSSDRIQELPDQNAAESVGRLPGIAVQRDAGEGQKVVIRGLSPKFNAITVNGERIPATDGEDRSVDLSMISPDVLAGIEVFKALTPDKDADAIGGTVNFVLRKASERRKGNVRFQTGYNAHEEAWGQFKGSASLSDRFFDNRLGALVTGSVQRADRSSDVLDAEYEFIRGPRDDQDQALLNVAKLNLADRLETRDRFSSGLTLDYDLNNGGLLFSTFWGRTDRDELRRRKRYRVADGRTELDLRDRDITILLLTNSLSGRHTFRWGEVHWRASRSRTLRKQPFGHFARFEELAAFTPDLIDDQGPELIPAGAENKLDATTFKFANFMTERVADRNLTGQIDLTIPFTLGRRVAGYLKAGGKHRDKHRDRDRDERQTPFAGTDAIGQETGLYSLSSEGKILLENFIDEDFDTGSFLEGRYEFGPGLDVDRVNDFWEMFKVRYQINRVALLDNYVAAEAITAGYVMAEINLGQRIMLLPGFRYESTENTYDASVGQLRADLGAIGEIADTTGGQSYGEFLPMVHLRLKLTPQFDVRAAVTRTLSRPDYFNLVPFERISTAEQTLVRGNPDLRHTTAWNYDLYLSLYNRLGLLTVGVYYKTLDDIDYIRQTRITEGEFSGYQFTFPENGEESNVVGLEIDLQTNLRFLPAPLDGVVLNANYAFADSETFFPFLEIGPRSPDPPFQPTLIDTARAAQIPGQARHVANVSVGYEKGGFSGRLSVQYLEKSLFTVGNRAELDGFTDDSIRWDLALSQRFSQGLSVFLNANNLSNHPERAFLGIEVLPTNEQIFGWTMDLGIKYKF